MIKELSNLIGKKLISVYNLKSYVLNSRKALSFIQNQLIYYFRLFLVWPYPPDQPKACTVSLEKLGRGWPHLTTPNQKYDIQISPFWMTSSMQKIWDMNWFPPDRLIIKESYNVEDYFGLLIETPCIMSKKKALLFC